ncbi:hypothetical protein ACH4FX_12345 [Streptomyces sp. NPDC018019]|uniref:hypothetical protein n=1 Tax=Streptomyces sp. NPDC018019 TaxID=3365030 RepID=UPI0037A6814C
MARTEAVAAIDRNSERVQELAGRMNRSEGKGAGMHAGRAYLVDGAGVLGTVIAIYLAVSK